MASAKYNDAIYEIITSNIYKIRKINPDCSDLIKASIGWKILEKIILLQKTEDASVIRVNKDVIPPQFAEEHGLDLENISTKGVVLIIQFLIQPLLLIPNRRMLMCGDIVDPYEEICETINERFFNRVETTVEFITLSQEYL
jgi:hypothetical protein